ncbi:uncharacterized protein K489DRAFT_412402 [Dissoconium aciculare CBS 342.82]|uniref:Uncharacterized protein n=1 Tax=Dissoconium aciculare CBS 342.82 TaxID=1314786 RepID=A0A6J3LWM7_9PEZI|nr:uncharacterized protein K489DRAFT_412402 [Dissoconium aciculare CBS 342.82]KAF1819689.1 hypothetical protein K489DRAFT_412402 [Dissoconium aciculare CBS 342.82]
MSNDLSEGYLLDNNALQFDVDALGDRQIVPQQALIAPTQNFSPGARGRFSNTEDSPSRRPTFPQIRAGPRRQLRSRPSGVLQQLHTEAPAVNRAPARPSRQPSAHPPSNMDQRFLASIHMLSQRIDILFDALYTFYELCEPGANESADANYAQRLGRIFEYLREYEDSLLQQT